MGSWKLAFRDAQNWLRLSALMALASYLEVYLTSAIRLALESDPGVLIMSPHCVDGVRMLKQRAGEHDYLLRAEEVVKGPWNDRISKFQALFGTVPQELLSAATHLDWMRRTRNGVGHAFGRDTDVYKHRITASPASFQALSLPRLQKLLGTVERVATAIDAYLLTFHIGEFEALLLWHEKQPIWRTKHDRAERLGGLLLECTGHNYGRQFCRDLVRYYEKT